ncbi:DUF2797 domain-containing protein [Streptomyces graminilatus]|uniref:DUF2797 domain-containing protein n=1 Tax=Streptomyces graminilatus TaxID=1464070 RepID=UPI0006E2DD57|nr:DUF2797 domain-containing protein [Streptomyces graminilatus]
MGQAWRCSGLRWTADGPVLRWDGGRDSALTWGKRVAFGVAEGGVRTCVGARGNACPMRTGVSGRSTGARCEECARLDRAHSVAADTIADDPQPYHVYLAWFGPGMTKVGITALERGSARLLEQGAVAFSWLGAGPLMAARRTEELLRAALGVPDRIPYADKRAVRAVLPGSAAERAAEVEDLHARAVGLGGWPDSLERASCQVVDHVEVFGLVGLAQQLAGPAPALGAVSELVAGGVVGGELVAAAGPDLHLAVEYGRGNGSRDGRRGVVVLDTRLMTGWELIPVGGGGLTVPVREFKGAKGVEGAAGVQDGLF